ncbi:MAG: GtrA family protein [Methylotetracoccus sp.]|nr:GtrA family protein [Methylotetracoccus sp.]
MTDATTRSAAYLAVSALCLVTHNAVMIAGDAAGLPLSASVLLSFCVVVVLGYVGHSRLTFREPMTAGRFSRYALAMAANLPTAFVTVWLARDVVGLPMIVAAPLSTVVSIGINFLFSRWAIVHRHSVRD